MSADAMPVARSMPPPTRPAEPARPEAGLALRRSITGIAQSHPDDAIEAFRAAGVLRPVPCAWVISQSAHGLLHVPTGRQSRGRPVVGTTVGVLGDTYRRPYRLGTGDVSKFARGWRNGADAGRLARLAGAYGVYRGATTMLVHECHRVLLESRRNSLGAALERVETQTTSDAPRAAQDVVVEDAAHLGALWQTTLDAAQHLCALLPACLDGLRGRKFVSIDFFLAALHGALMLAYEKRFGAATDATALWQTIETWAPVLARANGYAPTKKRELWPVTAATSNTVRRDAIVALMYANKQRTGDPFAVTWAEAVPRPGQAKSAHGAEPVPTRLARLRRTWRRPAEKLVGWETSRALHATPQPVGLEALRCAMRDLHVGMLYFDERLQRYQAVSCGILAGLRNREQARAVHDGNVRAAALAALDHAWQQQATLSDVTVPILRAVYQKRRRAIAERKTFPVFSNVPWRVTEGEARQLRQTHMSWFDGYCWHLSPQRANCNATTFSLVRLAAAYEPNQPAPAGMGGIMRYGARVPVALPRGRVLPDSDAEAFSSVDLSALRQPDRQTCAMTAATAAWLHAEPERLAQCVRQTPEGVEVALHTSQPPLWELQAPLPKADINPWWPYLQRALAHPRPALVYADDFLMALRGRAAIMHACDIGNPAYLWQLATGLLRTRPGAQLGTTLWSQADLALLSHYQAQHQAALSALQERWSVQAGGIFGRRWQAAMPHPHLPASIMDRMQTLVRMPSLWAVPYLQEAIATKVAEKRPVCLSTRLTLPRALAMHPRAIAADAWRATRAPTYGWGMLKERAVMGLVAQHCYAVVDLQPSRKGAQITLWDPDAQASPWMRYAFDDVLKCTIAIYFETCDDSPHGPAPDGASLGRRAT